MSKNSKKVKKKKRLGPDCQCVQERIAHLGSYFDVLSSAVRADGTFWFRGNADFTWRLTPSALRYASPSKRNTAIDLLKDFKRFGELKLPKAPDANEEFKWVQLAQHYGLPTRLLDWTKNAAVALYFACESKPKEDGAVFILNPIDLNREARRKKVHIFDPHGDSNVIAKYLELGGSRDSSGPSTIAVNPPWNSERIMLQQSVFTLHGSKAFTLTDKQAPSLVYLRIRNGDKQNLLQELERVGMNEMSIFPEAEHMCRYLKWRENLLDEEG